MNILVDQWSGLFSELENKVNADGRRKLLWQMIGEIQDVTVLNFGETGAGRPEEWPTLSPRYAEEYHEGDTTPTLILSGALRGGFVHEVTSESATLTNTVEYADSQQFGESYLKLPARPFYPIDEDGELTPYMQERLAGVVESYFQSQSH